MDHPSLNRSKTLVASKMITNCNNIKFICAMIQNLAKLNHKILVIPPVFLRFISDRGVHPYILLQPNRTFHCMYHFLWPWKKLQSID